MHIPLAVRNQLDPNTVKRLQTYRGASFRDVIRRAVLLLALADGHVSANGKVIPVREREDAL